MTASQEVTPRRIGFLVEYDGTDFVGWQVQKGDLPTIQGTLETTLNEFFGAATPVDGSSRTDSGVHAKSQVAAVTITHPIRLGGFEKAINSRLPNTISIREPREVPLGFFARRAVRSKSYTYDVYRARWQRPLVDRFSTRIIHDLDTKALRAASQILIGEHDFRAFAASDGQARSTTRTLENIEVIERKESEWRFIFTGSGFLKQMVRNLVGSLMEVGRGQRSVDWLSSVLTSKDRTLAGPTAPPRGLTLSHSDVDWQHSTER